MSQDWRDGACGCLLCQVHSWQGYESVRAAALGEYVETRTHTSAYATLCHPAGCPADPRARGRLAGQRTVVVPGPAPRHRAVDRPELCSRVACARVPDQQRREALSRALASFRSPGDFDVTAYTRLASRARRSKREGAVRRIEQELAFLLGPVTDFAESEPPEDLGLFPGMLADALACRRHVLDEHLRLARGVAAHLPLVRDRYAVRDVAPPDHPYRLLAADWRSAVGAARPGQGLLTALLRSDVTRSDDGLLFTAPGASLTAVAQALSRSYLPTKGLRLVGDGAAWAAGRWPAAAPAGGADALSTVDTDARQACRAVTWWREAAPLPDDLFPLPEHAEQCRSGEVDYHLPFGDQHRGSDTAPVFGGTWRLDDGAVPEGWDLTARAVEAGVEVVSTTEAFLRLCCVRRREEETGHEQVVQAALPAALSFPEAVLVASVDDLLVGADELAPRFTVRRSPGTVSLRAARSRPHAVETPRAEPPLLPERLPEVLEQRRTGVWWSDGEVQAWRPDEPWGRSPGRDLTDAHAGVAHVWTPAVDADLLRLAEEHGGFAPSVFAYLRLSRSPELLGAARAHPELAASAQAGRLLPRSTAAASALAFSRLRTLCDWQFPETLQCPLCGDPFDPELLSVELHVLPFGPPRWCGPCLTAAAWGSVVADRETALAAIRHLARVQGTAPRREWQREVVAHDDPDDARDAVVAARMAMPDDDSLRRLGLTAWSTTLSDAGVLPGHRPSGRGVGSRARDGHWCRSLFEVAVDDFLSLHGVEHECEPGWPQHPEWNPVGAKRADWRLADGTMVEAAGMLDDPAYAERLDRKERLAADLGIPLLVLQPRDLDHLDVLFGPWLRDTAAA